jgi:hypothetical protein
VVGAPSVNATGGGANASAPCPCSGSGVCYPGSGTCRCYGGSAGDDCSVCASGHMRLVSGGRCVMLPGALSSCNDGVMSSQEDGVDCGGGVCNAPCAVPRRNAGALGSLTMWASVGGGVVVTAAAVAAVVSTYRSRRRRESEVCVHSGTRTSGSCVATRSATTSLRARVGTSVLPAAGVASPRTPVNGRSGNVKPVRVVVMPWSGDTVTDSPRMVRVCGASRELPVSLVTRGRGAAATSVALTAGGSKSGPVLMLWDDDLLKSTRLPESCDGSVAHLGPGAGGGGAGGGGGGGGGGDCSASGATGRRNS